MSKDLLKTRADQFAKLVNKTYKNTLIVHDIKNMPALKLDRFSSGILSIDVVTGGGWPFGRLCEIAGEYSTGKTVLAYKAATSVMEFCHTCKKHLTLHPTEKCKEFTPCICLFIDQEGSFDVDWAHKMGFDDEWHHVCRPESAEQCIDIVDRALREDLYGLIVIDSVAAMTPAEEIEDSADEWQMGLAARLNNKAFRRWNSSLVKISQEGKIGPTILILNQLREKIGVMFGDPRVMPGGKGQEFCTAIIIWTKSAKIEDDSKSEKSAVASLQGVTKKNKTFTPKLDYTFKLRVKDTEEQPAGEVDNKAQLGRLGSDYGFVLNLGSQWSYEGIRRPTKTELLDTICSDPETQLKLWRDILTKATGSTW